MPLWFSWSSCCMALNGWSTISTVNLRCCRHCFSISHCLWPSPATCVVLSQILALQRVRSGNPGPAEQHGMNTSLSSDGRQGRSRGVRSAARHGQNGPITAALAAAVCSVWTITALGLVIALVGGITGTSCRCSCGPFLLLSPSAPRCAIHPCCMLR